MSLARGEGLYIPPGAALTPAAASWLAGIIGPARRMLDAADEALRAHVRAHGPVRLADGREWGPVLEEVTRYKTAETFEALAAVVGDEKANEAFTTSTTALKEAIQDKPRGFWKWLREDIDARGGAVVGAREVWRKRWPAKTVEVASGEVQEVRERGSQGEGLQGPVPESVAREGCDGPQIEAPGRLVRGDHGGVEPGVVREGEATATRRVGTGERVTRAPCPVCGRTYTLAGGRMRKHAQAGGGLRCQGSGQLPAQVEIGGT